MFRKFFRLGLVDQVTYVVIGLLLIAFLSFVLWPLGYVLIASFMDPNQLHASGLTLDIRDYRLDGYTKILSNNAILQGFVMALFYSSAFTFIGVSVSILMAFPLTQKRFLGKKTISILLIITLFFGGGLIPTFLLVRDLGFLNTIWSILLPGVLNAWNIILARSFLQTLPRELEEAAELDGASPWIYFTKIVVPLSKPIIAVLGLYMFVGQWNSYFDAMIYLEDRSLYPLQLVLRSILIQNEVPVGMTSAQQAMQELKRIGEMIKYSSIVVSSIPLILLYPFFQKYFTKGVMVGSIKA